MSYNRSASFNNRSLASVPTPGSIPAPTPRFRFRPPVRSSVLQSSACSVVPETPDIRSGYSSPSTSVEPSPIIGAACSAAQAAATTPSVANSDLSSTPLIGNLFGNESCASISSLSCPQSPMHCSTPNSHRVPVIPLSRVRFHPDAPAVQRYDVSGSSVPVSSAEDGGPEPEVPLSDFARFLGDDENSQSYLCICVASGRLGAAAYDCQTCEVHLLQDTVESMTYFQLLDSILTQIRPYMVLVSSRQDHRFIDALRKRCRLMGAENQPAGERVAESSNSSMSFNAEESMAEEDTGRGGLDMPLLRFCAAKDFLLDTAKRRVVRLLESLHAHDNEDKENGVDVENEGEDGVTVGVEARMLINFGAPLMIRSLGGLLKYLDVRRMGLSNQEYDARTPVLAVKTLQIENEATVDIDTIRSLQIFVEEYHPSAFKWGNAFKEGLSLFGVVNKCKSAPGKAEMRRMLSHPLSDHDALYHRYDIVEAFMRDENRDYVATLTGYVKRMKSLCSVLAKMKLSSAKINDWISVYKSLIAMTAIGNLLKSGFAGSLFDELAPSFSPSLERLQHILGAIINVDEMLLEKRFAVNQGVDARLDEYKQQLYNLSDLMTQLAQRELAERRRLLPPTPSSRSSASTLTEADLTVMYLPVIGYLLLVNRRNRSDEEMAREIDLEGMDLVYQSQSTAYYRSRLTRELDDKVGDVKLRVVDRETTIMLRVQNILLRHSSAMLRCCRAVAAIDCMLAFAIVARENDYVRPELVDDDVIEIVDGRHPLQEIVTHPFIPNTTRSGATHGKVKLLTGPNASGKSVYMKQVGLLCYMAHCGCFVPARSARFGPIDRIFTRIHASDSVQDGLSTFANDAAQVGAALNEATGRSLVIIDEFGKGTASEVGVTLLTATLKYWLRRGAEDCPHILAATHLHAALTLLPQADVLAGHVAFQTMDVLREASRLVFLYKLREGTAECSYAAHTALEAGIPGSLVQRAEELYCQLKSNQRFTCEGASKEDEVRNAELVHAVARVFTNAPKPFRANSATSTEPCRDLLQEILQLLSERMSESCAETE